MLRYKCKLCGYIYDPKVGEIRSKIEAGTEFEDLLESWKFPFCGAAKRQFKKI